MHTHALHMGPCMHARCRLHCYAPVCVCVYRLARRADCRHSLVTYHITLSPGHTAGDSVSTLAAEVQNPARTFPRALTLAMVVVVVMYVAKKDRACDALACLRPTHSLTHTHTDAPFDGGCFFVFSFLYLVLVLMFMAMHDCLQVRPCAWCCCRQCTCWCKLGRR